MLMKIEHLNFTYGQGTVNECPVLRDISFEIEGGEYIGLIGSSGSGKTTLMKHLNGLLKAQSGDVLFEGQSIYDKKYNGRFSQMCVSALKILGWKRMKWKSLPGSAWNWWGLMKGYITGARLNCRAARNAVWRSRACWQ